MEEPRKIDFKKHTSSPVSKWYLARVVFYVILLSVLLYFVLRQPKQAEKPQIKDVQEIENITIET